MIAASAMALATSCSSDSVIQENAEANAIKFAAVANNASRSADYYCHTLMPNKFDVWGTVDKKAISLRNHTQKEVRNNIRGSDATDVW